MAQDVIDRTQKGSVDSRISGPGIRRTSTRDGRLATRPRSTNRRGIGWAQGAWLAIAGLLVGGLIVASNAIGSTIPELMAALIAIAVSVVSPVVGLSALAFSAPLARPLVVPPPGLFVAMLAGMLFGIVLRLPVQRPRLRLPAPEVILLCAFMLYVAAQVVGGRVDGPPGDRASETASMFARLVEAVLTLGIAYVVLRGRSPYPILAVSLVSAVLAAVLALSQLYEREEVFGGLIDPAGESGRISGAFADPNYFGSYLAAMIMVATGLAILGTSRRVRAILILLTGFLGLTLLFTLSRGALVALAAGFVAMAFARSRRTGVMAIAGAVLVGVIAYPVFTDVRFGDAGRGTSDLGIVADASGRTEAWSAGLALFESSPIFGVGFGRWQDEAAVEIAAHNWYVQLLAELGIVGLLLWSLFLLAAVVALRRVSAPARMIGFSVLVVWMVASVTLSPPTLFRMTGPVLIVVAAACVADWSRNRRDDAEGLPGGPASQEAIAWGRVEGYVPVSHRRTLR